ncbi:hypothetical protein [Neisseria animaloris]
MLHKKFHKTSKDHRDCLKLCSSSNEDSIPDSISALANRASCCYTSKLN